MAGTKAVDLWHLAGIIAPGLAVLMRRMLPEGLNFRKTDPTIDIRCLRLANASKAETVRAGRTPARVR